MKDEICTRTNCGRKATHYCVIRVTAIGQPLGATVGAIMDLPLCRDHAEDMEPDDFLTTEGKAILTDLLRRQGRADPDFDRARVDVRRLGDSRWTALRASKGKVQ